MKNIKRKIFCFMMACITLISAGVDFSSVYAEENINYEAYKTKSDKDFGQYYIRHENSDEEGEVVYCYNENYYEPSEELSNPTKLYVKHIFDENNSHNLTTGNSIFKGKKLYNELVKIIALGYPNNKGNLQGDMSDDDFRYATQRAVWYVTDGYNLDDETIKLYPNIKEMAEKLVNTEFKISDENELNIYEYKSYGSDKKNYQNFLSAKFTKYVPAKPELPSEPKENKIKVIINKKISNADKYLAGAELLLNKIDGNNKTEIARWETENEDKIIELIPGEYELLEINAPDGYKTAKSIKFKVEETGSINEDTVYLGYAGNEGIYVRNAESNEKGVVAYCFNASYQYPNSLPTDEWLKENNFNRSIYRRVIANNDNFSLENYVSGNNQTGVNLNNKIKSIIYNGYPLNKSGIQEEYNLINSEFISVTQQAIHHFTDGREPNFSGNKLEAYNSLINKNETNLDDIHLNIYIPLNRSYGNNENFQNLLSIEFVKPMTITLFNEKDKEEPPKPTEKEIKFSKVEVNGSKELQGAELKVVEGESAEGKVVESWTSGKEQKEITLPEGTYTMVETQAPEGYKVAENITFRVTHEGKLEIRNKTGEYELRENSTVKMEDALKWTPLIPAKTKVKVTKVWNGKHDENAEVKVYLLKNGIKTDKFVVLNKENSWTAEFKELPTVDDVNDKKENNYTVEEEGIKDGKVIIKDNIYKVETKGNVKEGYTITNKYIPTEKEISFSKVEVNGSKELQGAELKVVEGESAEGKVVESWTSGKEQKEITLPEGTYTMVETQAPKGYKVAENITFRVTHEGKLEIRNGSGNYEAREDSTVKMEDALKWTPLIPAKTKIKVTKVWNGKHDENAEVKVYLLKNGEKTDKSVILTKENNWTAEFKELPTVDNVNDKKENNYTVEEEGIKDGKVKIKDNIYKVETTGNVKEGYTITNKYIPTEKEIKFSKVEVNGSKELQGAELKVVEGESAEGKVVESWTSGKEQKEITLPEGTYTMVETQAPEGYKVAENITFRVTHEGKLEIRNKTGEYELRENSTVKMEDALKWTPLIPAKTKIKVTKVWNGKHDENAEVKVYLLKNGIKTDKFVVLNKENNWTAEFKELPTVDNVNDKKANNYTVEEEGIKDGKVIIKDNIYKVEITGNVKEGYIITNKYIPTEKEIKFSKVEVNGSKELPGAELKVVEGESAEGKVVESWTSGKEQKEITLPEGTYTMVETQAPKGYKVAENITFRVTHEGKLEIRNGSGNYEAREDSTVKMEDARIPNKPEPNKPEPNKPEPNKPEPNKPETNKPEPNKPEPNKPEPNKPEPNKPEPNKPEPNKPEPNKLEPNKPEPNKPESNKPEPNKPEPNKPEPNKVESDDVSPQTFVGGVGENLFIASLAIGALGILKRKKK